MPSFSDSAFIFLIALLLFGPKKLPELARYVGKLMAEFRRASNEFRTQMEDELRLSEQQEQQKKIQALEAASPVAPIAQDIPEPEHPHIDPPLAAVEDIPQEIPLEIPEHHIDGRPAPSVESEPEPIASSGDLHLYPPATGLPHPRTSPASSNSVASVFESIPHAPAEPETTTHG